MPYRKILAIKLRALGDTVLMTAPLAELRRAYPGAEIHAAVLTPWAPLLEGHPAIDRVWAFERHADRAARAKALASMAIKLRRERFDCVLNFHASPSSSMLAFSTGAKTRSIHFHGHKDKNRYSTVQVPGKGTLKPIIERDMDTVRALGLHVPAGKLPQVSVSVTEHAAAKERLSRLNLSGPVLGLGLGAARPTKNWPVDRFAELAVQWCQQKNGSVIAVAGPSESEQVRGLLQAVDDTLSATVPDLAQRATLRSRIVAENGLSVRQLTGLLSALSAFAGNDSGPRHVALATGTPTVTLFGPESPFEWHPYPATEHPYLFIEDLPCRKDADPGMPPWCSLHECVTEQHRCLRGIGVNAVLAECLKVAR
jgi:ADP-heptose:LPS heptosyltransferase